MKKRLPILLVLSVAALSAMTLSGCGVLRKSLVSQGDSVRIFDESNVFVSMTFLDDAALQKRFGDSNVNPFLTPYHPMMFRRLMPFELKIINNSGANLEISTRDCLMRYEGLRVIPYNKFQLEDFWENRDEVDSVMATDHSDKVTAINRNAVDTFETIANGSTFSKILVFVGDTPDYGAATVSFILRDKANPRVEKRIEFEYKF